MRRGVDLNGLGQSSEIFRGFAHEHRQDAVRRLGLDASLYTLLQILSLTLFEKMSMQQALSPNQSESDNLPTDNQLNLFAF